MTFSVEPRPSGGRVTAGSGRNALSLEWGWIWSVAFSFHE